MGRSCCLGGAGPSSSSPGRRYSATGSCSWVSDCFTKIAAIRGASSFEVVATSITVVKDGVFAYLHWLLATGPSSSVNYSSSSKATTCPDYCKKPFNLRRLFPSFLSS